MERKPNLMNLTPAEMAAQWGAPFVRRDQKTLDRATGGIVNARTCANEDSRGVGPGGKVYFLGRVCYQSLPFFEWLASKIETERMAKGE